jgi:hypothetical protein
MSLQFISDSSGQTTGVFIPINDWIKLKNKFKGIENEETEIPDWHKEIVKERLNGFQNNKEEAIDFDEALNDIENEL